MVQHNNYEEAKDKQQFIVSLALIQQLLSQNIEKIEADHLAIFGNGTPENSIIWSVKKLTESINKLDEKIETCLISESERSVKMQQEIDLLKKDMVKFKGDDINLTWKQWFKKITLKWFPFLAFSGIILFLLKDAIIIVLQLLVKWST